jgi:hypothetical protein
LIYNYSCGRIGDINTKEKECQISMKKTRDELYAEDVINSFLPKGVDPKTVEHIIIDWNKHENS